MTLFQSEQNLNPQRLSRFFRSMKMLNRESSLTGVLRAIIEQTFFTTVFGSILFCTALCNLKRDLF